MTSFRRFQQLLPPYRILIIGTTGCGKTTVAVELAKILSLNHFELDAFHWKPNWQTNSKEEFRSNIERVIYNDKWVIDGNYRSFRDVLWPRASNLIWLDYPLRIIILRLIKRSIRRIVFKETLWNGNISNFRREFLGRNSILYDSLNTYWFRKRDYEDALNSKKYLHINVIKLDSPKETKIWLENLKSFWYEGDKH